MVFLSHFSLVNQDTSFYFISKSQVFLIKFFLKQKNTHLHIGMYPNAMPFSLQKRRSQKFLSISEHFTQHAQWSLILTKDGWLILYWLKWLTWVCFVCCETAVLPTTCFPKHHPSFFPCDCVFFILRKYFCSLFRSIRTEYKTIGLLPRIP